MQRYGSEIPVAVPDLDMFLRHRSVRKFDDRLVDEATVEGLMAAAQSASTSSNLQLWSAVSVQEPTRRAEIARLCADQAQVHQAPWFFAFVADHYRIRQAALAAGVDPTGLDYAEFAVMAFIDVSLAAERFVCAAESLGLGVCYIGALRNHPAEVAELLNLPTGTFGAFGLCVGYPSDEERGRIKPRLSQGAVWFREKYDQNVTCVEYDERMAPGYAKRGIDSSWSKHSGVRVDGDHMTGREVLLDYLRAQGFLLR